MITDVILSYPIAVKLSAFFLVSPDSGKHAYVTDTATYRFASVVILIHYVLVLRVL